MTTVDLSKLEARLSLYRTTLEHIARIQPWYQDGGRFSLEIIDSETGDWSTKETKHLNPNEAMLGVIRLARATLRK